MIESILSNIAILLLMHLCINTLYLKKLPTKLTGALHIAGTIFTIVCFYFVAYKINGFYFDYRVIPIAIIGLFHGWKYAFPVIIVSALARLGFGGEGAVFEILFTLVIPGTATSLLHLFSFNALTYKRGFIFFTFIWLIADLPLILQVADAAELYQWLPIRFVSFHFLSLLMYFFITNGWKQLEMIEKLQFYAEHDQLTGLYNLRKFIQLIDKCPGWGEKEHYIAMIDLDRFKVINDTYGHLTGDKVLEDLAAFLLEIKPENMIVGRYGGEEFIGCLAVSNAENAASTLEEIRLKIRNHHFYTFDGERIKQISVSIGFAKLTDQGKVEAAVSLADKQLYKAKKNGRNQVCSF
ncbi:diguanylate cyclase [Pseudalkalibacillus caeni]|uniref:Diguanylate cyclase n=1 Tax=Exobacillus caeni TaxID=2574798 RepID=A0A5R9EWX2_9BACL|nr:diguanylate cyclase [Pseudalkalibacillus caeni]TLS35361.1 diguanylate cyclase [Pseudalkalibacillus caeni]